MALSFLQRHYASSSSRPLLFIKSRFLTSKAFLFSAEPSWESNTNADNTPPPLLEVKDLRAVVAETNQEILKGVNLLVRAGEIHTMVGQDGSGKSTLMKVLLGDPVYRVTGGSILYKGNNLLALDPQERSPTGGFISFNTLDSPYRVSTKVYLTARSVTMRSMRKDYEGGRKRRNDIRLLAVLGGELGVLDEIYFQGDEMVEVIAKMNVLLAPKYPSLMIKGYDRLAKFAFITRRHVMEDGIIRTDTDGNWYDMSFRDAGIPNPPIIDFFNIDRLKFNQPRFPPPPPPPSSFYMLKFPAKVVGADLPVKGGGEIGG